jgi:hypothetical protein
MGKFFSISSPKKIDNFLRMNFLDILGTYDIFRLLLHVHSFIFMPIIEFAMLIALLRDPITLKSTLCQQEEN